MVKFTGERLVPDIPRLQNMIVEELGRLYFARNYFQNARVLDFGCGTGYATDFLFKQGADSAIGIDISSDAIRFASDKYGRTRLSYCKMDCLNAAFSSATFDFICSLDVIEHFKESQTDRFLSEIVRLLTPDGCCLITTPNKLHTSPKGMPTWEFHYKEFFYDELCAVLSRHFNKVQIFGGRVPVYEDRSIRRITNSPLAHIKHFLPAKIRVGISSGLRFFLKSNLTLEDVIISKEGVEQARVFVALCWK